MSDQCRELLLVGFGMKASIERGALDASLDTLLQGLHLRNKKCTFLHTNRHDLVVTDEAQGIFDHQDRMAELNRLSGFAAFDEFRVRFKEAEQFLHIGNRFTFYDTSPCRVAYVFGRAVPVNQLLIQKADGRARETTV